MSFLKLYKTLKTERGAETKRTSGEKKQFKEFIYIYLHEIIILEVYTILHDRQIYLKLIAGYSMRKSDEKFRDEQKKQCTCKMQNAKKFIIMMIVTAAFLLHHSM